MAQSGLAYAKKVVVLGAGRVGKTIALDLARTYNVVTVDADPKALQYLENKGVHTTKKDVTNPAVLCSLINDSDLVINALPGHLGFSVLRDVIACGKPIVDISFFPEDPFELDASAKERGVIAIVDCGIAPGLGNIILGFHHSQMKVKSYACYCGGLPKARVWPWQYKAPFSPVDVIELYTRPARMIENGILVTKPALSEIESLDFEKIGTLEAFNTDGLRTLLKTIPTPWMKEKTLRYPRHIEYIKVLRDTGFFELETTSQLLFRHWQLCEGEEEFTVMRIAIEGKENGRPATHCYTVYDEYDKASGLTSMARITGYTCTAVAHLVLGGRTRRHDGYCAP